jgi:positive regulator of sigma E activity
MFDLLASLAFTGLLLTTAVLKMMGSKDTQDFKLYLLLSTLAFLIAKIYNAVKYYEGVRLQAANEESTTQSHSTSF